MASPAFSPVILLLTEHIDFIYHALSLPRTPDLSYFYRHSLLPVPGVKRIVSSKHLPTTSTFPHLCTRRFDLLDPRGEKPALAGVAPSFSDEDTLKSLYGRQFSILDRLGIKRARQPLRLSSPAHHRSATTLYAFSLQPRHIARPSRAAHLHSNAAPIRHARFNRGRKRHPQG